VALPDHRLPLRSRRDRRGAGGRCSRLLLIGERKVLGLALTLAAGSAFVIAGGGLWAQAEWWRALAVTGAALSLAFFAVFFQPLILFGMALDVAVIVALVWLKWPSESMVGA
jgi:hypothetical protein